jgi:hypothetical protein
MLFDVAFILNNRYDISVPKISHENRDEIQFSRLTSSLVLQMKESM